jgi:hypothetical protein
VVLAGKWGQFLASFYGFRRFCHMRF